MKIFSRLPLYLGLGVLVLAVLVSTKKISDQRSLSNAPKASQNGAVLTIKDDGDGKVSVLLTSDKEVAGIDAVIKFDNSKVKILPSTLDGGISFITSGGVVDDAMGTFSFTAFVKNEESIKSAIVASFKVESINEGSGETELMFETGEEKTVVIDKTTGEDILTNQQGIKLNLIGK